MKYSKSQWLKWDTYATLKYAKDEGREETKAEIIKNLLSTGKFTVSELADITKVPEAFVNKVIESLQ